MTKVQILTTPGCTGCKVVERMLAKQRVNYDVIDVTKNPKILEKYQIMTAPGIVINGKLEFTGIPSKEKLLVKLKK